MSSRLGILYFVIYACAIVCFMILDIHYFVIYAYVAILSLDIQYYFVIYAR